MSRRRRGRDVHGVVLLDKPAGPSSNQALQRVRRLFDARKAGHTGNLDPFASGMLPICLGEATKTAGFMLDADKTYRAVARLGVATATGDTEGEEVLQLDVPRVSRERLQEVFSSFLGEIEQVPPMFSALKHQGRPLYEWARRGVEIERKSRRVTIHHISLRGWERPLLDFEVRCSKGTYIRTLAEDLARALGTCAHLVSLRRTQVGPFTEPQMWAMEVLENLAEKHELDRVLLPADAGLAHWPLVTLDDIRAERFRHGNPVVTDQREAPGVRVAGPGGELLGLGAVGPAGEMKPLRVFRTREDQDIRP